MNTETLSAMNQWLSAFPETSHPCDNRRFYNFVLLLCQEEAAVSEEDIIEPFRTSHPGYTEAEARKFAQKKVREIEQLRDFYDFLNNH